MQSLQNFSLAGITLSAASVAGSDSGKIPTKGGTGANGGAIAATNDGTIITAKKNRRYRGRAQRRCRRSRPVSGGHGWYNAKRFLDSLLPGTTARSDPELSFISNRLRIGHAFEKQSWYVRPMVDLGVSYLYSHAFGEHGADGANLNVKRERETYVSLTPALEIGGERALLENWLVPPYVKLGLTHFFTGTTPRLSATMQGAPAGVAAFTVEGKNDKNYGELSLGADLLSAKGFNLRVGYRGQFSNHTNAHGGFLKLSIPF